jgi:AbrB family looped-hinge helix DNA binding protein
MTGRRAPILALTIGNWVHILPMKDTMKATIDRFGRIVLPKKIRDLHGLSPGSNVEIEDAGDSIKIHRLNELPGLVEKDGIVVFRARPTGDLDAAIRTHRDERLRTVRGPAR